MLLLRQFSPTNGFAHSSRPRLSPLASILSAHAIAAMAIETNLHPRRAAAAAAVQSHDEWSENEKAELSPPKDRRRKRTCSSTCSSGIILPALAKVAQQLESIQVSKQRVCCQELLEKYGRDLQSSGDESPEGSSGSSISALPDVIPLISGLTPVLSGAAPAADTVRILSIKPPRYIFYSVSGFLCDIVQLFIDLAVHFFLKIRDPSLCWAIGFGLSIVVRHSSHRYFTFGSYVGGYWRSLGRMYFGYSFSIALSTAFNVAMARIGIAHYIAFVFTLLWTGIVNYFILKRLWSFDGSGGGAKGGKLEKQDSRV